MAHYPPRLSVLPTGWILDRIASRAEHVEFIIVSVETVRNLQSSGKLILFCSARGGSFAGIAWIPVCHRPMRRGRGARAHIFPKAARSDNLR
ncbi:MAG: hypothetical protein ABI478_03520 [Propionivibrio sp.]